MSRPESLFPDMPPMADAASEVAEVQDSCTRLSLPDTAPDPVQRYYSWRSNGVSYDAPLQEPVRGRTSPR